MKKLALIIYTFVFLLLFTASTNAQWKAITDIEGTVISFAVSGTNIFAGTSGNGVYVSNNNGNSWTTVNGLPGKSTRTLAINGTNVFAGTDSGLFVSSNNGGSWTSLNKGLPTTHVNSLLFIGSNIFVGLSFYGVYLSTDNGITWKAMNNGLINSLNYLTVSVFALAISGTNIIAATWVGVYLSSDNGSSWTCVNYYDLSYNNALSLAVKGENIFAGGGRAGVFLSTDKGRNWAAVNNGLSNKYINKLAFIGTNIFAGTDNGVFLSNNNGGLWTYVNNGFPKGVNSVFSLATNGIDIFAGTQCQFYSIGAMKLPLKDLEIKTISGKVFNDSNNNCKKDSLENTVKNSVVEITSDKQLSYYATPDSNGYYSFLTDSGTYTLTFVNSNSFWKTTCPATPNTYNVNFSAFHDTSANNDFGSKIDIYCPLMWVDIATSLVRPGRQNTYTVNYCNKGTEPAANSYITIEFDKNMTPISSTLPWSSKNGNTYTFDLGTVNEGECGSFYITDSVSQNAVGGSTLCTKAKIFPDTICTAQNTNWDESDISVKKECMDDSIAHFVIYNEAASMIGKSDYRIYADNALALTKTFQLASDDSLIVNVLANGSIIRLEADQREGHPGMSRPRETVENCKANNVAGMVNSVPQDDADEFVEIDCQEVRASFDPNEKLVVPTGITDKHYISAQDELEYQINFQNTGNDTAFLVVLRDTLPQSLEITSVVSGSSSHPYTFRIYGQGILEWTFKDILLVDSTTNEPQSHGFVKYRIKQKANNPKGTLIENRAAIYFDFNEPVITNAATNTVYDTTIVNNKIVILGANNLKTPETGITLYPNPTSGTFTLAIETTSKEDVSIKVYNLIGEMLYSASEEVNGKYSKEINLHKASGIYFVQVQSGKQVYNKKLVVQ